MRRKTKRRSRKSRKMRKMRKKWKKQIKMRNERMMRRISLSKAVSASSEEKMPRMRRMNRSQRRLRAPPRSRRMPLGERSTHSDERSVAQRRWHPSSTRTWTMTFCGVAGGRRVGGGTVRTRPRSPRWMRRRRPSVQPRRPPAPRKKNPRRRHHPPPVERRAPIAGGEIQNGATQVMRSSPSRLSRIFPPAGNAEAPGDDRRSETFNRVQCHPRACT
mmetsp:Transcript_88996/g.212464  ORF Transcript_88996/g.212464 Transcript_88996/m.212464 type:complete len:217 (+) Transcript_88996:390-1040(+)